MPCSVVGTCVYPGNVSRNNLCVVSELVIHTKVLAESTSTSWSQHVTAGATSRTLRAALFRTPQLLLLKITHIHGETLFSSRRRKSQRDDHIMVGDRDVQSPNSPLASSSFGSSTRYPIYPILCPLWLVFSAFIIIYHPTWGWKSHCIWKHHSAVTLVWLLLSKLI